MVSVTFEAPSWRDLSAQLRTALANLEMVAAHKSGTGNNKGSTDQGQRMATLLTKLSPNALKVVERHAQGKATSAELGALVGGIQALRGVNSQISALAKKCGLTYDELIVRDYQNYNTVGTEYLLTPEFLAVVEAAAKIKTKMP
jgi:hypothetical protein